MYFYCYLIALYAFWIVTANSQTAFSPLRPPSFPLAVKTPYLSTWLPAGTGLGPSISGHLAGQWATFWTGEFVEWTGLIRVDGKTFLWMGALAGIPKAEQTYAEYTSTKTAFTFEVGKKVLMQVTFLSPITPLDLKRQSLPFSYMEVQIWPLDGKYHSVQLYTDVSAHWVTGDLNAVVEWNYQQVNDVVYHQVWKQHQQHFSETQDRAEWGNLFYATDYRNGLTVQSGTDDNVRAQFILTGGLTSVLDMNFGSITDRRPVFAYALDLGYMRARPKPVLFTIGLCQDQAVQFLGKNGVRILPSLWKDYFNNDVNALYFAHKDYPTSSLLSTGLDNKIARDSVLAAGTDYLAITSLAVRQAFGATQLVGTALKPYLFMKEISSNGNTQTVDVIFPSSPIFFYLNPHLIALLLDPHFEHQDAGHYPNTYPIHDLGTHYPNATGHTDGRDEPMPLEESGNHLLLILTYAQRTHNLAYLRAHYPILKQWAEYLVSDALYPSHQLSTDDFAGFSANQTNLALKGIIALEAMSRISSLINEPLDAARYTSIAHDYLSKWLVLGINSNANPPHATQTYNNASTFTLLYNLYFDTLAQTHLIPPSVYSLQSSFYPTVQQRYGVPLDSRNPFLTKVDWEIFCAAVAGPETKGLFVKKVKEWLGSTGSMLPFTDLYETDTGEHVRGKTWFMGRPVVGGMFALLALKG
ncbi:glutaminase GtaA [Sporormia fimetaria CBS 119925]|uniref:Glutaminase GtaA n=1 Tax=Sporormia fimetaria CBS 119925 TaxID=1340428 RepID=A0A6A6V7Z4_9PLEO|nr:glutaminase GtaA [Sporormia fimetaria CBS 119925]